MRCFWTIVLLLTAVGAQAQYDRNPKVNHNGKDYWLYEYHDSTYLNTSLKFYYKYDSTGAFLRKSQQFPKDGWWIGFFKQDSLRVSSIFTVKDGMLEGPSKTFSFRGLKSSEVEMSQNMRSGSSRFWYTNGNLAEYTNYQIIDRGNSKGSVKAGKAKSWYESGQEMKVCEYDGLGKLTGEYLEYFENGTVKKRGFYINGKRAKTLEVFHEFGQLYWSREYANGEVKDNNPTFTYHPNGKVASTGNTIRGKRVGPWQYFDEEGNLMAKGEYEVVMVEQRHSSFELSVKSKNWEYYHTNAKLKAKGSYDVLKEKNNYLSKSYISFRDDQWEYFDPEGQQISAEELVRQFGELQVGITYKY